MTQKLSMNGKIAVFAISLAALALNVTVLSPNAFAAGGDIDWGLDSAQLRASVHRQSRALAC